MVGGSKMVCTTLLLSSFVLNIANAEVQRSPGDDPGQYETYKEILDQLARVHPDTDENSAIYRENPGEERLNGFENGNNLRGDGSELQLTCPTASREGVALVWKENAPKCQSICGFPNEYQTSKHCHGDGMPSCACPEGTILDINGWVCISQKECDTQTTQTVDVLEAACKEQYSSLNSNQQTKCCDKFEICAAQQSCPKPLVWSECVSCPKTCGAAETQICNMMCRKGCTCPKDLYMNFGTDGKVTCVQKAECPTKATQVQTLGGNKDKHGCLTSAGYEWCGNKNTCVRPFELGDFETVCNAVISNTDGGYNCLSREVWSTEKSKWCCNKHNLGCSRVDFTSGQCFDGKDPSKAFGEQMDRTSYSSGKFVKSIWLKKSNTPETSCAAICMKESTCQAYEFHSKKQLCITLNKVPSLDSQSNWKKNRQMFTKIKLPLCDAESEKEVNPNANLECTNVDRALAHFAEPLARRVKNSNKYRIRQTKTIDLDTCLALCITHGDECEAVQAFVVNEKTTSCEMMRSVEDRPTKSNRKWKLYHKTTFCEEHVEEEVGPVLCPMTNLGYFKFEQKQRLKSSNSYTIKNVVSRQPMAVEECAKACRKNDLCLLFEYNRLKSRCELKAISSQVTVQKNNRWDQYTLEVTECETAEDSMNRLISDLEHRELEDEPEVRPLDVMYQPVDKSDKSD